MSTTVQDPLGSESASLGGWFSGLRRRVRQGDVGSLPVIAGLVLIWVIFGFLNPNFLSPRNLTNLMLQIAGLGTSSVGIVGERSTRPGTASSHRSTARRERSVAAVLSPNPWASSDSRCESVYTPGSAS